MITTQGLPDANDEVAAFDAANVVNAPLPTTPAASPPPQMRGASDMSSVKAPSSAVTTVRVIEADSEPIRLESIHAYLLLSDDWAIPAVEPEGMRYVRWRRSGDGNILVPLKTAPEKADPIPGFIAQIVALEGRHAEEVNADLRRLHSMRTINRGPYQALREGEKDSIVFKDKTIESLILVTTTFVVYLDSNYDVYYQMGPDFGDRPADFGEVVNRLSVLLAEPIAHLAPSVRKAFRTLLAEGVARVLHDKSAKNADAVFDKAESFLRARNNESARLTYLGAAIPTTLIAILADVLLWTHKEALDHAFVPGFTTAAVAASMGAIGAFLSIFLRLTSVDIDASAGKLLLVVECTLRVFVGVVVAAVVGWAVHANLLLGFTSTIVSGSMGTKMLIGLLSGASERAMPTLMKKFEATLDDETPASSAAAPPKPTESAKLVVLDVKPNGEG
jgi:hypothetical protein